MPRPLGRDRLEPSSDGTVLLLSLRPKPWKSREEASAEGPTLAGTAVQWDGELYELLRVERREAGGFRHVLAPWDERLLVRSCVEYRGEESAPSVEAAEVFGPPGSSGAAVAAVPGAGRDAWSRLPRPVRDLTLGFVPAVLLGWLFPFRIMREGISFLVHELGHTLAGWLFGCTALPAVVITIAFDQVLAAAVLIWGGLAWAAFRYRRVKPWNAILLAAAVVYPFLAFTKAYLTVFDLGGHLAEALFCAFALRRALDAERPAWERPVWAFLGFALAARNVGLFAGVAASASARTDYLTIAIAGRNDLVKVADTTGIALETLAALTALVFVGVTVGVLAARWAAARRAR